MPDWEDQLNAFINGNSTEKEINEIAEMKKIISRKWLRYNECISVEFDTDKGTAIVKEN